MNINYIHLCVRSTYSLLRGAIGLKDLAKWCVKKQMPAVAVCDFGNFFGSLEFAQAAAEMGVQPIMATTLFIKPPLEPGKPPQHGAVMPDTLNIYVQSERGWQNAMALSSEGFLNPAAHPAPMLEMASLEGKTDGLIALTGAPSSMLARLLLSGQRDKAEAHLAELQQLFPQRLYIQLQRHGMPEEAELEPHLLALAYAQNIPLVAVNDAHFIDEEMFEAHDAFLCIAEGTYVGDENHKRLTPEFRLKTPKEMEKLFADIPEALANTVVIAKRCSYMAPARKPILPNFVDESGNSDADAMLAEYAREGLRARLEILQKTEEEAKPYWERLEFEIATIIKMKFPGYFLIVSDFIRWSKSQGIPVGPGRGSGAGSVVAWALNITDLDPLRYGLLFERFLNPERVSMPDFDVDFCQDRRDEVIEYVQRRYGADRVAQIITFGKLQARAVLRDVGRVLQMPYGQVDRICKLVPANPANPVTLKDAIDLEPALKAAIREDEAVARLIEISLPLEGLNRHASTHAAGVVIADRPLTELAPMYKDPKSEMPVVQYSMKYAEAAGLVKFDFLGLKTLSVLVNAVKLVAQKGVQLDLLLLPEGDKKTYEMLSRGETVGVFQLEGQGMRDTVKRLKPDCLEDIIALVSLYRPGPMDNIPTYIARKHGVEKPNYLHPWLEPILKETYGVIIYQEQVMQIAQVLAGYSLGEADLLRRAMGKKIRSEMEAQREVFVKKAVEKGVARADAAGIFDLIQKFAEYGFNKSHAAAYAFIAYQTAYLKANHTVEFIAASMNYDMHNTDKLGIFREDAVRYGIKLLPPDVNRSQVQFSVERETWDVGRGEEHTSHVSPSTSHAIRYALAAVRNVGTAAMQAVVEEREANGPYKDLFDFAARVPMQYLNKRAVEYLIKAGAMDALHSNRAQALAALDLIVGYGESMQRDKHSQQTNLFGGTAEAKQVLPALPPVTDWPSLEKLSHEFDAIGFYLSAHPLEAYRRRLNEAGITAISALPERLSETYTKVKVAGIVTGRKFKASDRGRFAFVQLSDMSGVVEFSIFSEELLTRHREKLEPGQVLMVSADGKLEESGPRLIAQAIADLNEEIARAPQRGGKDVRLEVVVNNPAALPNIREALGQGNGTTQVLLRAPLPSGEQAEIALPGRYAITPVVVDKLRVIQGVLSAEEA